MLHEWVIVTHVFFLPVFKIGQVLNQCHDKFFFFYLFLKHSEPILQQSLVLFLPPTFGFDLVSLAVVNKLFLLQKGVYVVLLYLQYMYSDILLYQIKFV